jgi:hypothetical protein
MDTFNSLHESPGSYEEWEKKPIPKGYTLYLYSILEVTNYSGYQDADCGRGKTRGPESGYERAT